MTRSTTLLAAAAMTLAGTAGGLAAATSASAATAKPTIIIGNQGFSEDNLVAQMYADVLQHAGYKTSIESTTGRPEVLKALAAGAIDLEPDYAGSLLVDLKPKDTSQATQVSTDIPALKAALVTDKATVLNPSHAIDTNVFVVLKSTATKYHLTTLASLKGAAPQLVLGAPSTCPTFYYCIPGLEKVYGIKFKSFLSTDYAGPITVGDLQNGKVQVAELFSSDGDLVTDTSFVQLTDNKHLEPADYIVPVIRTSVDTAAVSGPINALDVKLTTPQLIKLNIDLNNHETVSAVASKWLKSEGLL